MRKVVNTFKHNKSIHSSIVEGSPFTQEEVAKYLDIIVDITMYHKDYALLELIRAKYPTLFDSEFYFRHNELSENFQQEFFKLLVQKHLDDNENIVDCIKNWSNRGNYVRTLLKILLKDRNKMLDIIERVGYRDFSCYILNLSHSREDDYLTVLGLIGVSQDPAKIKYYILWSLYHYYKHRYYSHPLVNEYDFLEKVILFSQNYDVLRDHDFLDRMIMMFQTRRTCIDIVLSDSDRDFIDIRYNTQCLRLILKHKASMYEIYNRLCFRSFYYCLK